MTKKTFLKSLLTTASLVSILGAAQGAMAGATIQTGGNPLTNTDGLGGANWVGNIAPVAGNNIELAGAHDVTFNSDDTAYGQFDIKNQAGRLVTIDSTGSSITAIVNTGGAQQINIILNDNKNFTVGDSGAFLNDVDAAGVGHGTATFTLGQGDIAGTVGATKSLLALNLAADGDVTVTGAVAATTTTIKGAHTATFVAGITGDLAFAAAGTAELGAITGAVTTTANGQGTLVFTGAALNTNVGTNTHALNKVTVASAADAKIGDDVYANTIHIGGNNTLTAGVLRGAVTTANTGQGKLVFTGADLNQTVGTGTHALLLLEVANAADAKISKDVFANEVKIVGDKTLTVTANITGNLKNSGTADQSSLNLQKGTITGNVGGAGAEVFHAVSLAETSDATITGDVYATTVSVSGANTATFGGTVKSDLEFAADGTAKLDAITGAVTTTANGQGTLVFTGAALNTNVGTNTHALNKVTVASAADAKIGDDVYANTIHIGGNNTLTAGVLRGAVTTATAGKGTLVFTGANLNKNVGTSTDALAKVTVASAADAAIGDNVYANTIHIGGDHTLTAAKLNGAVTTATSGKGTLVFTGADLNQTVGDALAILNTVKVADAADAKISKDVVADTVQVVGDKTLTVTADITGNVTNSGTAGKSSLNLQKGIIHGNVGAGTNFYSVSLAETGNATIKGTVGTEILKVAGDHTASLGGSFKVNITTSANNSGNLHLTAVGGVQTITGNIGTESARFKELYLAENNNVTIEGNAFAKDVLITDTGPAAPRTVTLKGNLTADTLKGTDVGDKLVVEAANGATRTVKVAKIGEAGKGLNLDLGANALAAVGQTGTIAVVGDAHVGDVGIGHANHNNIVTFSGKIIQDANKTLSLNNVAGNLTLNDASSLINLKAAVADHTGTVTIAKDAKVSVDYLGHTNAIGNVVLSKGSELTLGAGGAHKAGTLTGEGTAIIKGADLQLKSLGTSEVATNVRFKTDHTVTVTGKDAVNAVITTGTNNEGTLDLALATSVKKSIGTSDNMLKNVKVSAVDVVNFEDGVYSGLEFGNLGTTISLSKGKLGVVTGIANHKGSLDLSNAEELEITGGAGNTQALNKLNVKGAGLLKIAGADAVNKITTLHLDNENANVKFTEAGNSNIANITIAKPNSGKGKVEFAGNVTLAALKIGAEDARLGELSINGKHTFDVAGSKELYINNLTFTDTGVADVTNLGVAGKTYTLTTNIGAEGKIANSVHTVGGAGTVLLVDSNIFAKTFNVAEADVTFKKVLNAETLDLQHNDSVVRFSGDFKGASKTANAGKGKLYASSGSLGAVGVSGKGFELVQLGASKTDAVNLSGNIHGTSINVLGQVFAGKDVNELGGNVTISSDASYKTGGATKVDGNLVLSGLLNSAAGNLTVTGDLELKGSLALGSRVATVTKALNLTGDSHVEMTSKGQIKTTTLDLIGSSKNLVISLVAGEGPVNGGTLIEATNQLQPNDIKALNSAIDSKGISLSNKLAFYVAELQADTNGLNVKITQDPGKPARELSKLGVSQSSLKLINAIAATKLESKVAQAFNALEPAQMATLLASIEENANIGSAAVGSVISSAVTQVANVAASRGGSAIGSSAVSAGDDDNGYQYGVWSQAFAGKGEQNKRKGVSGHKETVYGLTVGADSLVSDDLILGAAVTHAQTRLKFKDLRPNDKSAVKSLVFTAYGRYSVNEKVFVEGSANISTSKLTNTALRTVATGQSEVIKAKESNIINYGMSVLAGYNMNLKNDVSFSPVAGLSITRSSGINLEEQGNGDVLAKIKSKGTTQVSALAGARFGSSFEMDGMELRPSAHAMLNLKVANKAAKTTVRFDGIETPIDVTSPKAGRASFDLGFGATLKSGCVDYTAGYNVNFADKYTSHTGSLKVRVNL